MQVNRRHVSITHTQIDLQGHQEMETEG
uniref:Uncharacterized protein n=1 Tax=Anguilla anguilla TaxID=7936 RepID=A0A0E9T103_ANGAN